MPFDVVAIVVPHADKVDRLGEVLKELVAWVKENEPDTLRYLCGKVQEEGKSPYYIFQETYKDDAAYHAHHAGPQLKKSFEVVAEENLVSEPVKIVRLSEFAGFHRS